MAPTTAQFRGQRAASQAPRREASPARARAAGPLFRPAFTLIELLMVIAIIALISAISVPAIRSMGKSNDLSQGANLVRSMMSTARGIAISQHRMAGVVFFEETSTYSLPVHGGQTAMQLCVEAFDQAPYTPASGVTVLVHYNTARQYLPAGVRLASLSDVGANVVTGDKDVDLNARCILFDATGQLVVGPLQKGLAAPDPTAGAQPGVYPKAYGNWNFLAPSGGLVGGGAPSAFNTPSSSPGFFLFNDAEYKAQPVAVRLTWLKRNATVILVNGNTGGVLR